VSPAPSPIPASGPEEPSGPPPSSGPAPESFPEDASGDGEPPCTEDGDEEHAASPATSPVRRADRQKRAATFMRGVYAVFVPWSYGADKPVILGEIADPRDRVA
jgi:hypothetical protein